MKKFWQKNRNIVVYVLKVFLIWEAVILFIDLILPYLGIPLQNQFKYVETVTDSPKLLWNRANFDGIHYIDISRKGYGIYQQAFFPFYPELIKLISPVFLGKKLLTGFIISNLSFLIDLFVFYKLILLDYDDKIAKRTLLYLLLFPVSFYFSLVYTESLFFLFLLLCFYFAGTRKWFWSGIFGALAANTRIIGIFLFPAIIYEWWQQHKIKHQRSKIKYLLFVFIIPLGMLSYMCYLKINYNDPLMFIHTQLNFGAGRSGGMLILPYQVMWRYLKMIIVTELNPTFYVVWLELLTSLLFTFLIIKSFLIKIKPPYLIFTTLAFILPTLSGTLLSFPRFCLLLFPCFMCMGIIKKQNVQRLIVIVFFCLAIINIALFFSGYWVS